MPAPAKVTAVLPKSGLVRCCVGDESKRDRGQKRTSYALHTLKPGLRHYQLLA